MNNNANVILLSALLLSCNSSEDGSVSWGRLPDLPNPPSIAGCSPVPLGVSAPFTGLLGKTLVVAGGCNFPEKPVAEGGIKRFYDEIWALDLSDGSSVWKVVGHLPHAVAYGCSVTTPSGIVCLGGNDADRSFSECFALRWNQDGTEVIAHPLQPLPCTVDNSSAAFSDGRIYVAGGNADGLPSRMLICGALSQDSKKIEWSRLPDFPGPTRVQPVLAAIGAGRDLKLCLAGGFQPGNDSVPPQLPPEVLLWQDGEWSVRTTLPALSDGSPRTLTGGCAVASSGRSVLLFGGVNHDCFLAAVDRPRRIAKAVEKGDSSAVERLRTEAAEYLRQDVSWYRFNDDLWEYDITGGRWRCLGADESLARAGAGAVMYGNSLLVVCGELKPGVRTPQVSVVTINE